MFCEIVWIVSSQLVCLRNEQIEASLADVVDEHVDDAIVADLLLDEEARLLVGHIVVEREKHRVESDRIDERELALGERLRRDVANNTLTVSALVVRRVERDEVEDLATGRRELLDDGQIGEIQFDVQVDSWLNLACNSLANSTN